MKTDETPNQGSNAITSARFTLVGFGLQPAGVTIALAIEPTCTDVRLVRRCGTQRKEECGVWSWDTANRLTAHQDDINAHIEFLLSVFRGLRSRIEEIRPRPNAFVDLRCKPASNLRPIMVPQIQAAQIAGIAELGAALKVRLVTES